VRQRLRNEHAVWRCSQVMCAYTACAIHLSHSLIPEASTLPATGLIPATGNLG
jgi:hypothetical protein